MTDTAQTTRPTHCPTCGVKLPDIPVSLCAYCASPVSIGEKVHGGAESPNKNRIAKIAEHKTYEEICAYNPPESLAFSTGMRKIWHGRNLVGISALILLLALLWTSPFMGVIGILTIAGGVYLAVKGMAACKQATSDPLTHRAGMIVDRRSETAIRSWNGETVYFFTIEFDDGSLGEYQHDGRGASEDPYPSGMTGVAFLRGAQLLEFKQIRV